eukprot:gene2549-1599_t
MGNKRQELDKYYTMIQRHATWNDLWLGGSSCVVFSSEFHIIDKFENSFLKFG